MGTPPNRFSGSKDVNSDQTFQTKPRLMETVTTICAGKSKPLPLPPAVSIFSTYNTTREKAGRGADLNRSHVPWEEAESSKTSLSLSSSEVGWQSAQGGELAAPKYVRKVESEEKLVGKGPRE